MFSPAPGPIGIFDSGYGGLTIFDKIREAMPGYDYVYLGDNAVRHTARVRSRLCIVLQGRLWKRFSMKDASL